MDSMSKLLYSMNVFVLLSVFSLAAFFCLLMHRETLTIGSLLLVILPVARGGPLLDINTGLFKLALTAAFFLAVIHQRIARRFFSADYHRIGLLMVLLSLIAATAFLMSEDKTLSSSYTACFFTSILAFFIFCRLFDRKFLRKALVMLSLSTFGACGLAILQYVIIRFRLSAPWLLIFVPSEIKMRFLELGGNLSSDVIRLPSFFFHSNGFGHFLAMVFGLHFVMFIVARKRKEKILYFASVLAILISCLLTLSRGSVLIIAGEGLVLLILFRRELIRTKMRIFTVGTCFLLIGIFALGPNLQNFLERIQAAGLANRDINWGYAIRLLPRHFLFGTGPGMCSYQMLSSYPFSEEYFGQMSIDLHVSGEINWYISHAHNFYLNAMIETGLFSLLVYGILFWNVFRKGFQIYSQNNHVLIRALAAGSFVALLGSLLRGTFESYVFFDSSYVGYMISFYFAVILYLDGLPQIRSTARKG